MSRPCFAQGGLATRKKAVESAGKVLAGGFSASEGIREIIRYVTDPWQAGWMRGKRARGDVVGGTFPHLDMVTPIGGNNLLFFENSIYVLARGRTAIVISGSYRARILGNFHGRESSDGG